MTRMMVLAFACVTVGGAQAQEAEDTCGAAGLQGLVGQTGAIVEMLYFPDRIIRVHGPEDAVTLDYRPERLNILVDEGVIDTIRCG